MVQECSEKSMISILLKPVLGSNSSFHLVECWASKVNIAKSTLPLGRRSVLSKQQDACFSGPPSALFPRLHWAKREAGRKRPIKELHSGPGGSGVGLREKYPSPSRGLESPAHGGWGHSGA